MDTKLCMTCQRVLEEFQIKLANDPGTESRSDFLFVHHHDLQCVEEAVATGCDICRILLSAAKLSGTKLNLQNCSFTLSFLEYPRSWSISWNMERPQSNWSSILAELILMPVSPPFLFKPIEESTDSRTTSRVIRKWYRGCLKHHYNCFLKPGVSGLPTRLLHLEEDSLRLCDSSEIPCDTQYATLSHCWGGLESLRLLKSNYKEFMLDIPRDRLCKNFTDAIQITKRLEISYLWIDSLCIVQDDPDDWRHESALMSDVYGHSSINIAAADAENGNIGCFFRRNPRDLTPLRIKLVKQNSPGDYIIFDSHAQTEQIQSGALVKRAWAFQERFLSPRTLHFTRSQVFWECTTQHIASEVFPAGFIGFPYRPKVSLGRERKLEELWPHIVSLYSMGQLTYGTDKLIALSGVAKWYQDRRDDQYLAGLWKNDLARGLLWVTTPNVNGQSAKYQAPSWSWASQNKAVDFEFLREWVNTIYINLLDAQIQSLPPNSMGQVTSGYIRLKCRNLLCGYWFQDSNHSMGLPWKQVTFNGFWDVEPWVVQPVDKRVTYLLPIMDQVSHSVHGIMIKPSGSPSAHNGWFRRVGYFRLDLAVGDHLTCPWEEQTEYFRSLQKEVSQAHSYIPADSIYENTVGEDERGNKLYTIVLV